VPVFRTFRSRAAAASFVSTPRLRRGRVLRVSRAIQAVPGERRVSEWSSGVPRSALIGADGLVRSPDGSSSSSPQAEIELTVRRSVCGDPLVPTEQFSPIVEHIRHSEVVGAFRTCEGFGWSRDAVPEPLNGTSAALRCGALGSAKRGNRANRTADETGSRRSKRQNLARPQWPMSLDLTAQVWVRSARPAAPQLAGLSTSTRRLNELHQARTDGLLKLLLVGSHDFS
jgi:hypothetical protein